MKRNTLHNIAVYVACFMYQHTDAHKLRASILYVHCAEY